MAELKVLLLLLLAFQYNRIVKKHYIYSFIVYLIKLSCKVGLWVLDMMFL